MAAGLEASGLLSARTGELAVANSHALWAYHTQTAGSFKTVVMSERGIRMRRSIA